MNLTEQGAVLSKPSITLDCYRHIHQKCDRRHIGSTEKKKSERLTYKALHLSQRYFIVKKTFARIFLGALESQHGHGFRFRRKSAAFKERVSTPEKRVTPGEVARKGFLSIYNELPCTTNYFLLSSLISLKISSA
jgi:hypothetical protein